MAKFIRGLDLSEAFFREAGKPVLDRFYPGLKYSAALIGYGSDVIGFDDEVSTDHMWGPRFYLFLDEKDIHLRDEILSRFSGHFPREFRGYPTNFSDPDPDDNGVRKMTPSVGGSVHPLVFIHTLREYFTDYLGIDPAAAPDNASWLAVPEHRLLATTFGRVFHDDLGLEAIRERFAYYPRDVWLYLAASVWQAIDDELPFAGRCGEAGDDTGSRLVAARTVHRLMRLCFLIERKYAPYGKWFGTAFRRLEAAPEMLPVLDGVLEAGDWRARQEGIAEACEIAGRLTNGLGLFPALDWKRHGFFGRKYPVVDAAGFVAELTKLIGDGTLQAAPKFGSASHFSDICGLSDNPRMSGKLWRLYG